MEIIKNKRSWYSIPTWLTQSSCPMDLWLCSEKTEQLLLWSISFQLETPREAVLSIRVTSMPIKVNRSIQRLAPTGVSLELPFRALELTFTKTIQAAKFTCQLLPQLWELWWWAVWLQQVLLEQLQQLDLWVRRQASSELLLWLRVFLKWPLMQPHMVPRWRPRRANSCFDLYVFILLYLILLYSLIYIP